MSKKVGKVSQIIGPRKKINNILNVNFTMQRKYKLKCIKFLGCH